MQCPNCKAQFKGLGDLISHRVRGCELDSAIDTLVKYSKRQGNEDAIDPERTADEA